RGLHLLDEDAAPAHLMDRDVARPVARGLDDDDLDLDAGAQQASDVVGLPAGESAPSGGSSQSGDRNRFPSAPAATGHRSNRARNASASRSPLGEPAASLSRMVGSWSSLLSIALVTESTAARWRGSRPSSR